MMNFYDMYKYMRVLSFEVQLTCYNESGLAIVPFLGVLPYTDIASTSVDRIIEQPNTVSQLLSAKGGLDKVELKRTFDCLKLVGSAPGDRYWIPQTQAVSTTPVDVREPALVWGAAVTSGGSWSAYTRGQITYHVEFFDLQYAA